MGKCINNPYGTYLQASGVEVVKEFSGKGLSPYSPNHNSTALFLGKIMMMMTIMIIL